MKRFIMALSSIFVLALTSCLQPADHLPATVSLSIPVKASHDEGVVSTSQISGELTFFNLDTQEEFCKSFKGTHVSVEIAGDCTYCIRLSLTYMGAQYEGIEQSVFVRSGVKTPLHIKAYKISSGGNEGGDDEGDDDVIDEPIVNPDPDNPDPENPDVPGTEQENKLVIVEQPQDMTVYYDSTLDYLLGGFELSCTVSGHDESKMLLFNWFNESDVLTESTIKNKIKSTLPDMLKNPNQYFGTAQADGTYKSTTKSTKYSEASFFPYYVCVVTEYDLKTLQYSSIISRIVKVEAVKADKITSGDEVQDLAQITNGNYSTVVLGGDAYCSYQATVGKEISISNQIPVTISMGETTPSLFRISANGTNSKCHLIIAGSSKNNPITIDGTYTSAETAHLPLIEVNGSLTLGPNVILQNHINNTPDASGTHGAIYINNGGTTTVKGLVMKDNSNDVVFSDGKGTYPAGDICVSNGTLILDGHYTGAIFINDGTGSKKTQTLKITKNFDTSSKVQINMNISMEDGDTLLVLDGMSMLSQEMIRCFTIKDWAGNQYTLNSDGTVSL